ncbi:hypothetical protein EDB84DRAFT_489062 [Lactarius hengduanensis]|nr:hypothetical protein EDB84DRAFT_489062 [Lactarius hengduanensis]
MYRGGLIRTAVPSLAGTPFSRHPSSALSPPASASVRLSGCPSPCTTCAFQIQTFPPSNILHSRPSLRPCGASSSLCSSTALQAQTRTLSAAVTSEVLSVPAWSSPQCSTPLRSLPCTATHMLAPCSGCPSPDYTFRASARSPYAWSSSNHPSVQADTPRSPIPHFPRQGRGVEPRTRQLGIHLGPFRGGAYCPRRTARRRAPQGPLGSCQHGVPVCPIHPGLLRGVHCRPTHSLQRGSRRGASKLPVDRCCSIGGGVWRILRGT